MAKKTKGLSGVDGMTAAVIAQARRDALSSNPQLKQDALRYLRSPTYRKHLRLLERPDHWLPADD